MVNPQKNRSPLAQFIGAPGGATFDEALRAGQRSVERLRVKSESEIGLMVERIEMLTASSTLAHDEGAKGELLECAQTVQTLAGLLDLAPLGRAAQSMLTLLDEFVTHGFWDCDALDVHSRAVAMLHRNPKAPPDLAEGVVSGLSEVASRLLERAAARAIRKPMHKPES